MKILVSGVSDDRLPLDFFHETRRDSLLDMEWSDGTEFETKGDRHRVIPIEYWDKIQFWKNDVYEGHYAVTYDGRVVYDEYSMKVNQPTAMKIVEGIEHGYSPRTYMFED